MTTAIIGIGNIGGALARHLARGGDRVVLAAKDEANAAALAQELGEFARAARVFAAAGVIAHGEEQYRYYYAVALYETSRYGDAKRELAAALPHITVTPGVARYRAKIEGAIE